MKKFVFALIIAVIAISFAACMPEKEKIEISKLSEYTIVYPEGYSEWKMTEINLLKKVISRLSGKEINAVPDTVEATGKEIILASSSRKTKFDEQIDGFDNGLSYVVGVDENNIVLGGKGYYADMRAIYDFINNVLGYDDMKDEYKAPEKYLVGSRTEIYKEPSFRIMGSNFSCYGFDKPFMYRDFADAGFNVLHVTCTLVDENIKNNVSFRDMLRMCARFGIKMVYLPALDWNTSEIVIPDEEDIRENPSMWGVYVVDEPATDELCETYKQVLEAAKEKYADTGWKFYANTALGFDPYVEEFGPLPGEEYYSFADSWKKYFANSDALSFDWYINNFSNRDNYVLYSWNKWRKIAQELGQEYYIYIDAWNLSHRGGNTSKMFRSHMYLALCFDCDMAEYFQYGDASPYYTREGDWSKGSLVNYDYTFNDCYYHAQKANREILKVTDILKDYDYAGIIKDCRFNENFYYTDEEIENKEDYVTVQKNGSLQDLLFGCYDRKDGDGKAMILMNLKALDDFDYDKSGNVVLADIGETRKEIRKTFYGTEQTGFFKKCDVTLRFAGENVKCYKDGELKEMKRNEDGTYTVEVDNGDCYLFTMD